MKCLFMLILFCQLTLDVNAQKITLKLLNSKLENNQYVNIEIKNDSKFDYCFVIDTLFYIENRLSYDRNFDNFSISLCEIGKEKKISSSREVKNHRSFNDSILNQTKRGAIEKKK